MPKDPQIFVVLHNIRSAYNVGSIFRTADGAGVSKIYLCGYTPTPETSDQGQAASKIAKIALGAEKNIFWEHHKQTWRLLEKLKKGGVQIIVLEQTKDSIDYRKLKPKFPLVLIVGNEVNGLSKNILKYADIKTAIPMHGRKESLNVSVAFGISIYEIVRSKR